MHGTIIALWGKSRSGKTTTVRHVYERLQKEATEDCNLRRRCTVEVCATLIIDGVKVGFASRGDLPDLVEEDIKVLLEEGCIVIVCATHTRQSKTWDVAGRYAPDFNIVRIEKACQQTDHDDGNRKKANEIIREVRKAIENAQLVEA